MFLLGLICASLDIVGHELARLERLRLYATGLSDWQTITILDAVLNDMMEVKHRLTELIGRYVHLDTDWEPESNPVPGDTFVDSASGRWTGCNALTSSARRLGH